MALHGTTRPRFMDGKLAVRCGSRWLPGCGILGLIVSGKELQGGSQEAHTNA